MNKKDIIPTTIKVVKGGPKLITKAAVAKPITKSSTQSKQIPSKPISSKVDKPTKVNKLPKTIRKGLLVGLNYTGTSNQLAGCINDTENLKKFLVDKNFFKESELTFMNDKLTGDLYPNKANIMKQLNNLVSFANNNKTSNVSLFFAYSGHGAYIADKNGDEADKRDEVICPLDFQSAGFIIDDDIRKLFIDKLPSNVKIVMLFDSCFSGTVCDLKYSYKVDPNNTISAAMKLSQTVCNIVMISGCKDTQTSADAYEIDPTTNAYEYQGAMSASFIANYTTNVTYNQLITKMRLWLKQHSYLQIPQLSSGKLVNIDTSFLLNTFI